MDLNLFTLSGALSRFSHFTCTCFNKVKLNDLVSNLAKAKYKLDHLK